MLLYKLYECFSYRIFSSAYICIFIQVQMIEGNISIDKPCAQILV